MITQKRIEELAARRGAHWSTVLCMLGRMRDTAMTRDEALADLESCLIRFPDWTHTTVMAIQTGILEHFQ